jgi:thioredoxin/glutathione reductase (selenoprotein)
MADLRAKIEEQLRSTHVLMYCKTTCPFCAKLNKLFSVHCVDVTCVCVDELDKNEPGLMSKYLDVLNDITGQKTVPNVFINGKHLGGCNDIIAMHSRGDLVRTLVSSQMERDNVGSAHSYDYDIIVIGGGSGGLSCAKAAGALGAKVACMDFVKPSPIGTKWGLGGTCVNVGCIPKKLMHQAALLGHALEDSRHYGWDVPEGVGHKWEKMVESIQAHIASLNWGYRTALRKKSVKYLNALTEFVDPHTIKHVNSRGVEGKISGARIVIATGGRPRYPDIPGAEEYGISSDDVFSMTTPPGKTLVVGASYVALECAGFLAGLGFDVTCMVRSILLRGFDQQMAELIKTYMADHKVKFLMKHVPTKVELVSEGPPREVRVTYRPTKGGEETSEVFNTVLFGVGRDPDVGGLGLEKAGVKTDAKGYIPVVYEQTNVPHIYATGDVVRGMHELTPLAIQAGRLLAARLFGSGSAHTNYVNTPTTVFTPLEFGAIGLAEEDAIMIYGSDNIEVYHSNFWPLEYTVAHREENVCYCKLICNKLDKERVIGLHVLGPNAGEITQGYAVAMKLAATKEDFDLTVGIHPTCSETFTTLSITKSSGVDVASQGC